MESQTRYRYRLTGCWPEERRISDLHVSHISMILRVDFNAVLRLDRGSGGCELLILRNGELLVSKDNLIDIPS